MPVYPLSPNFAEKSRPADVPADPGQPKWRRGMYRLWILASIAWMLGWGLYLSIYAIRFGEQLEDLLTIPVVLFGPPAALLVFAYATVWAFRGFLADQN
jgi:hypothetical protein